MGHDPLYYHQRQTELIKSQKASMKEKFEENRVEAADEKRSLARERLVAQYYRDQGFEVWEGEDKVREHLDMPKYKHIVDVNGDTKKVENQTCDVLAFDPKTRTLYFADSKGKDELTKGLHQCNNTAEYAQKKYSEDVKFQPAVWLNRPHPQANPATTQEEALYSFKSQTNNHDGPWKLFEKNGAKETPTRLKGEFENREVKSLQVHFGPDTEKGMSKSGKTFEQLHAEERQTRNAEKAKVHSVGYGNSEGSSKSNEQSARSKT